MVFPIKMASFRLTHRNPQWPQEFEQTKSSVLFATQGWVVGIEHIGSTALADGISRPIIDVMAGMQDLQGLNQAAELINGLNFRRLESPTWCDRELCAYLEKPREGEATHSVLLVRQGGILWRTALAVRRFLNDNLLAWQQLQSLKQDNFHSGCQAYDAYCAAKNDFFTAIVDQLDPTD